MKTARKAIMLVLCVVLLVVASVMGTLAYLTDDDAVVNTFTVGNIQINLDESNEATPEDSTDRTETGNAYDDIQPGQTYVKDPTVTVLADSEDCYVRMLLTVTYDDCEGKELKADDVLAKYKYQEWFDFNTNWTAQTEVKTVKANGKISRTYEFRYNDFVTTADGANKLPALFTKITVPGAITNAELATLENLKIDVVAQAMQKAGFGTAELAWAEWK